jgi:hypothetical protein
MLAPCVGVGAKADQDRFGSLVHENAVEKKHFIAHSRIPGSLPSFEFMLLIVVVFFFLIE